VTAELKHAVAGGLQDLRNEQPKLAVTEHRDLGAAREISLIENLARRGKGFGKDRDFIGYRLRNDVKINFGQRQKFAKGARVPNDPKNLTRWAVPAKAALAPITTPAGEVDFADNPASGQTRIVGLNDLPNELMSGSALIACATGRARKRSTIRFIAGSFPNRSSRR
jgi:hypothetical protein